jgi:hypothetical protein
MLAITQNRSCGESNSAPMHNICITGTAGQRSFESFFESQQTIVNKGPNALLAANMHLRRIAVIEMRVRFPSPAPLIIKDLQLTVIKLS